MTPISHIIFGIMISIIIVVAIIVLIIFVLITALTIQGKMTGGTKFSQAVFEMCKEFIQIIKGRY